MTTTQATALRELENLVSSRVSKFDHGVSDAARTQGKHGHHKMLLFAVRRDEASFILGQIRAKLSELEVEE